ncbi:MAG: 2-hydroxyglutaryl-CoA dehydratase [Dehalococcoidia bacterium DG_18]|nr:MAG: 2-hydroxyglutaryl-CoA dehydratase [Dehalococcoidia bacterium DG_18]
MTTIGITTTVPIEVLLAAGYQPVDLNNLFISDPDPERLVGIAERAGFPINCCTWIKGIYGVAMEQGIENVLCVTTGDCSNTIMLMEVLKLKGLNVIPFAYPDRPDVSQMQRTLESLARTLGTTVEAAEEERKALERARGLAEEVDELTWQDGLISGWENHFLLVSSSDFMGDIDEYQRQLSRLLAECRERNERKERNMLRIAYIGVPSIFAKDLYHFLESQGARVVFNEIQRQFAMPLRGNSLAEQYSSYTYPYSIFDRLNDILPQLRDRRVDGVIHYVQAFCHRGIGDIIFRQRIDRPILTLEGNNDFLLTQHLRTRIEAFLDMIKRRTRSGAALK